MRWKIEKGEIKVQVGASLEDIRLEDAFYINEDLWIEGRERRLYELFIAGMWLCVVCGTGAEATGSGGGYFTE